MSLSPDNEMVKQPIKRLEIPINKFNDVAIPHHLDLLKRHKNNIKKVCKFNYNFFYVMNKKLYH
jgi:hypothetical protein